MKYRARNRNGSRNGQPKPNVEQTISTRKKLERRTIRQLLARYGTHEEIQRAICRSALPHATRKKIARVIDIPAFQGWVFIEEPTYWGIVVPKGRIGKPKVCENLEFDGKKISVLPSDNSLEATAKNMWRIIRAGIRVTQSDPSAKVLARKLVRGNPSDDKILGKLLKGKSARKSTYTIYLVARKANFPDDSVACLTWKNAVAFCNRFKFHLGILDDAPVEKDTPQILDSDVFVAPGLIRRKV